MAVAESKPVLDPKDLLQAIDFALDFFNRAHQKHALRTTLSRRWPPTIANSATGSARVGPPIT